MKIRLRLISLLLLAGIVLSAVSCGGTGGDGKAPDDANENETTSS